MDRPTCLALCAGIGGLELGVHRAIGCRVVGYVERDAYAAAILLARMEDSSLEPAPVWCGNLEELDTSPFLGVDLVTAGFPCQPFSVAGKRKRLDDERWIWPAIAGIIGECRPSFVFLENVPGILVHGAGVVLGDLAALGYDATWDLFSAADVGAPQRRERWFCLAHAHGGWELQPSGGKSDERGRTGDGGEEVADARRERADRDEPGRSPGPRGTGAPAPCGMGEDVGNAAGKRLEGWELPSPREAGDGEPWPPGPEDVGGWERWIATGGPEPALRGGAARIPDRMDRLRCLGNAVVPACAELAFRTLMKRLED